MINWFRTLHIWHTWTPWGAPEVNNMSYNKAFLYQTRKCVFCNRFQQAALK